MKNIFLFVILLTILFVTNGCAKKGNDTATGTCSDGIMNQDESAIDCGGKCSVCATCSDGIQNQGETKTDCGGPCTKCMTVYPAFGNFGPNLLRRDTITVKAKNQYSLRADIAENSSLKIVFTKISGSGYWGWLTGSQTGWIPTGNTEYFVNFNVKADIMILFSGTGSALIQAYEDGSTNPSWNRTVSW